MNDENEIIMLKIEVRFLTLSSASLNFNILRRIIVVSAILYVCIDCPTPRSYFDQGC